MTADTAGGGPETYFRRYAGAQEGDRHSKYDRDKPEFASNSTVASNNTPSISLLTT